MAGETWARRIVEHVVQKKVVVHDDGSEPGMYDLRIGSVDAPEFAIECVGAVDPIRTETWNVGPARGPFRLSIRGDWLVTVEAGARIKAIKRYLSPLLQQAEAHEQIRLRVDHNLKRSDRALYEGFVLMGITSASCLRRLGMGMIYLTMDGNGGGVDINGMALPGWIGAFLRDPARLDVLQKLERSRASQRQVFVLVALWGSPWPVESYLTGDVQHLPSIVPVLPEPLTGVWIISTRSRRGVHWNGNGWMAFGIPDEPVVIS